MAMCRERLDSERHFWIRFFCALAFSITVFNWYAAVVLQDEAVISTLDVAFSIGALIMSPAIPLLTRNMSSLMESHRFTPAGNLVLQAACVTLKHLGYPSFVPALVLLVLQSAGLLSLGVPVAATVYSLGWATTAVRNVQIFKAENSA